MPDIFLYFIFVHFLFSHSNCSIKIALVLGTSNEKHEEKTLKETVKNVKTFDGRMGELRLIGRDYSIRILINSTSGNLHFLKLK